MKSMRNKLFWSALSVSMAVLFVTLLVGFGVIFSHVREVGDPRSVWQLLGELLLPALLIAVLIVPVCLLLSWRLSRSITTPLNRLQLQNPTKDAVYTELQPLIEHIDTQNRQIARQITDLTAEHEVQDAMRRDFTANVSHELKTPLTSISGYAELLKDNMVQPEDVPRFSAKIYDESQRLITLVGDIIKLSQLDSKEVAVPFEDIDLYDACAAVISHLEMAAAKKKVTVSLSGEHTVIHSAEQIVEEIIFNLCDNAIKYNRNGGSVTVSIRQCLDGVELTVQDTGIGIKDADLPHIFERFFRVDKSHSKALGGTGLGLSIVKHGARFLGAAVSVESKPAVGTTVRVLF